jgi:hypothetical protein
MVTDRTSETIRVATADAGVLIFRRVTGVAMGSCDFCGSELRGVGWKHSGGAHGDTLICDPCAEEARPTAFASDDMAPAAEEPPADADFNDRSVRRCGGRPAGRLPLPLETMPAPRGCDRTAAPHHRPSSGSGDLAMSRNLLQDPERLARQLEARGWNLVRAWRGVVSLGPPDPETARSYPFKHGFRGGWMAHEANPSLAADWRSPLLEAFQCFLTDEGLSEAPARPDDVRALMTGFATGVARRVEVLQEAGIWPAESAGLVVEWRGRTRDGRSRGGKEVERRG